MQSQLKFGEGIIGHEVLLSIQDCIVLKSLVEDLKSIKEAEKKETFAAWYDHAVVKAINFITKVSSDVISLTDASNELFGEPKVDNEL